MLVQHLELITIAGIIDDSIEEANETVIVTLSNPSNATLVVMMRILILLMIMKAVEQLISIPLAQVELNPYHQKSLQ